MGCCELVVETSTVAAVEAGPEITGPDTSPHAAIRTISAPAIRIISSLKVPGHDAIDQQASNPYDKNSEVAQTSWMMQSFGLGFESPEPESLQLITRSGSFQLLLT